MTSWNVRAFGLMSLPPAATRWSPMALCPESERAIAEVEYRAWVATDAQSMVLHLEAVEGVIK